MRKSMMSLAIVAAAAVFTAANASAQSTPGVDNRQHNQAERIYNGIQNGHLTFRESGQLIRGQARVHRQERRFKSDGVVTPLERLRLHNAQNRQSFRIYRKKHN